MQTVLNQKYSWLLFTSPNFSLTFDLLLSSLDQVIRPLRRSPGGALQPSANMSTALYLDGARVNIPSELSAFPACSVTCVHLCLCVRLRSPPSLRLPSPLIPPTLPLSTRCLSQQCAECSIPADLPNYHHRVSARPRPLSACSALNYTPACRACPIPGMPPRAQPGRGEPCLGFPQLAKQAPDCASRKRGGKRLMLRPFLQCTVCI